MPNHFQSCRAGRKAAILGRFSTDGRRCRLASSLVVGRWTPSLFLGRLLAPAWALGCGAGAWGAGAGAFLPGGWPEARALPAGLGAVLGSAGGAEGPAAAAGAASSSELQEDSSVVDEDEDDDDEDEEALELEALQRRPPPWASSSPSVSELLLLLLPPPLSLLLLLLLPLSDSSAPSCSAWPLSGLWGFAASSKGSPAAGSWARSPLPALGRAALGSGPPAAGG